MSAEVINRSFTRVQLLSYAAAAMGIEMVWATLTGFLPPMLERYGATPFIIGLLMSAGPATGLIVQPLAGLMSDGVRTRIGPRIPFILAGAPLAIAGLIGLGLATTLVTATGSLLLLCCAVNSYQGPYRAILGDEIAGNQHAIASSFQHLFGGIGMVTAFVAGSLLVKRGDGLPFFLTSSLLMCSTIWTVYTMGRLGSRRRASVAAEERLIDFLRGARNLHLLFAAQFCWWFAIQAASGFAVLFAVHDLKGIADINSPAGKAATSDAVLLLAVVTVTVLVAAVPVGLLAQKLGKRQVLTAGLAVMMLAFVATALARGLTETYFIMIFFGAGFACVLVIPFTILTELQPPGREGALAGVFNIFVALPQLVSLNVVGAIIEKAGSYRLAFWTGAIALGCAIVILQAVRLPSRRH